MAEISFYHVTRQAPLQALARLMEKVYGQGLKTVIRAGSEERVKEVDTYLWTYNPASFLPHGTANSKDKSLQPVYITADEENPNAATVLALLDNVLPETMNGYERVLYLFDGQDEGQTRTARQHWKDLKEQGHSLAYWEQQEGGGWKRSA
ncbi:DNA polymerase III subunit chi [Pedomonas mirosovicensis]|uniref:DNA polymerase III subunit chi n=1 Tax=Pedomonas mirosovicensis TaxID=2908641 RepID=UPI00216A0CA5|nr:DNA polymerase III subunit chi [Pedomonas mirosovicensis]MCH8685304.1 DNA polymerase III subunit chi [Pedomonas mirosovicensis]